jgi:hypothetical protein
MKQTHQELGESSATILATSVSGLLRHALNAFMGGPRCSVRPQARRSKPWLGILDNLNLQRAGTVRPASLSVSGIRGRALSRREPGETAFLRDESNAFFGAPRLSHEIGTAERSHFVVGFSLFYTHVRHGQQQQQQRGSGKTLADEGDRARRDWWLVCWSGINQGIAFFERGFFHPIPFPNAHSGLEFTLAVLAPRALSVVIPVTP